MIDHLCTPLPLNALLGTVGCAGGRFVYVSLGAGASDPLRRPQRLHRLVRLLRVPFLFNKIDDIALCFFDTRGVVGRVLRLDELIRRSHR
mgnify:CR=1 FL=1